MRRVVVLLLITLSSVPAVAQTRQMPRPEPLIFTQANIIDVAGAQLRPDMTVVIVGGREGRFADLVLLDANPLEDISNTKKIAAVIFDGRYLRREYLDGMLAETEAAAGRK